MLPFEAVLGGPTAFNTTEFNSLRLFRMLRVVREAFKPHRFFTRKNKSTNIAFLRLAKVARLLFLFFFLAHWVGCVWWAIGTSELFAFPPMDPP